MRKEGEPQREQEKRKLFSLNYLRSLFRGIRNKNGEVRTSPEDIGIKPDDFVLYNETVFKVDTITVDGEIIIQRLKDFKLVQPDELTLTTEEEWVASLEDRAKEMKEKSERFSKTNAIQHDPDIEPKSKGISSTIPVYKE